VTVEVESGAEVDQSDANGLARDGEVPFHTPHCAICYPVPAAWDKSRPWFALLLYSFVKHNQLRRLQHSKVSYRSRVSLLDTHRH
jgi:hypothetical protein